MHCPRCTTEYREGFDVCADCDMALVPGPPPAVQTDAAGFPISGPDEELQRVFESSNSAIIPLVKSLLDGAEIGYMVKGEALRGTASWYHFVTGPVEFFVHPEDAAYARELLEQIESYPAEPTDTEPEE
jgi:hypothetical protein